MDDEMARSKTSEKDKNGKRRDSRTKVDYDLFNYLSSTFFMIALIFSKATF